MCNVGRQVDIEQQKKVYETNVWGLIRVTQTFVPLMLAPGLPKPGRKRIVNVRPLPPSLPSLPSSP